MDSCDKFRQDIAATAKDYLEKLSRAKDQASPSLEYTMLYMARYEMYDQLMTKSINLSQDIYSDFGDYMFRLYQEQGELFKCISELALNLTRLEYDVKEQQEEQIKAS